ncbi:MAG: bifunctional histidinol-phosphatase/imidazoleglycerol-phosphate dehydratase HisB [Nevskiaceae bacterium]|jgi:imidazoleglycerol-phosphate dehydratase/histidinol-phosphatase|nr:bifunctional histidinol-phosphatase/imidazoleglycerol-phosphate dehydratase HisB [Nevskiaceae bacterium]
MSAAAQRVLFVDRDGTLIEEPADEQVDSLDKIRFMPGVFAALQSIVAAGYRLVMVTNQDGLGTASFPLEQFEQPQRFMLDAFASQGLTFDAICVCPHRPADNCDCRKPKPGIVRDYLASHSIDLAASAMVGDRQTDLDFAQNIGVRGFRVLNNGTAEQTWPAIARELLARRAHLHRETKETRIDVAVNLDAEGPIQVSTGQRFFDHMIDQLAKHGGFSLQLNCQGDLDVDEHHTVEDCALAIGSVLKQALGDKRGIGRYGFLLPMDEAQVQVAIDLSGRAYAVFEGHFPRTEVGGLATELVPHFFRSLSETLGAAIHVSVKGENTHHMVEACFKGVGRALRRALRREGEELPSTKGVL